MESRLKELDGIRGIAILMVMCAHIFKRADYLTGNAFLHSLTDIARLGWAGVDIFFVLSGFLITSILLKSKPKPDYFKNFYARRILRIFPLYYLVVIVLLFFLPVLDPDQGPRTQSFWPVFLLYQQNWLYLLKPEPSFFLGITWSLAIEEQFYLLWPAVVRFLKKSHLVYVSIGIVVLSLGLRLVLSQLAYGLFDLQKFFYYGTLTRFEGMAVGALVALAYESDAWKNRLAKYAWLVLGLAAAVLTVTTWGRNGSPLSDNYWLSNWGYTALALFAAALIVLVTNLPAGNWLRRFFGQPVLTFFGKYSYAIYMLHIPITILLLEALLDLGRKNAWVWLFFVTACFAGSVLAALLSWNLLEKHALSLKRYFE